MRKLVLTAGLLLAACAAQAAEAGKVIFVAGASRIANRAAALDGAVNEGELLTTGADGYIYIKTIDNGLFILRPNTQARIATYHVDTVNPANTHVKLELISGVARSQSGQAVKLARQNFRFNTPVAAIGVRGTDFTVFTDQDTSRVTVISGGITVSGFSGACRPEGSGPCEGNTGRELSAAQKGLLLQVQRGQTAPQLLQGNNSLAPDMVAPPRSDEPGKVAANGSVLTTDPSLDPKKNQVIQQVADSKAQNDKNTLLPPAEQVTTDPTPTPPVPPQPPKEVSWGRWTTIAEQGPTGGLSKAGADRIAMTEDFALFRSRTGSDFVTPKNGAVSFNMSSASAVVKDQLTAQKSLATVQNALLTMNFDKATFATSFDLLTAQSDVFKLGSSGKVGSDGLFSSVNRSIPGMNIGVTGLMTDVNNATYLFQGGLDGRRVVNGAIVWAK